MKKKSLLFIGFIILGMNMSMAQWVSNPSVNTLLVGVDSAYAYGEMVGNSNDSASYLLYYKSTFPNAPFFQLYLQKIDYHGYRKFGNDGIMIDSGPNRTWVAGVAVVPNQDSCVYLAYSKVQFYPGPEDTVSAIFMNKVTKTGIKMWGDNGIQISKGATTCSSYTPYLLVTEDNQICVGYITIDSVDTPLGYLQNVFLKKISATGTLVWEYTFPKTYAEFNWGVSMYPMSNGNIMAICRHDTSIFSDTSFRQSLWAQRFDASGVPLFAQPKNILTYPQYKDDYPLTPVLVESNSTDGFYFNASYDIGILTLQNFVQQIDANADTVFPARVPVIINDATDVDRTNAGIRYLPETQELLVIWNEKNYRTHLISILGQKISSVGTRNWGDSAKLIYPSISMLDSIYGYLTLKNSEINDESVLFFMKFLESSEAVSSYATKLDADGNNVWGNTKLLSNRPGDNVGLMSLEEIGNQWITYYDDRVDSAHQHKSKGLLFGQNIFSNGSIGTGIEEIVSGSAPFNVYPNPASSNIFVDLKLAASLNIEVSLWSADGRMIRNWDFSELASGQHHLSLDVREIPDGLYLLKLIDENKSSSAKVMILK